MLLERHRWKDIETYLERDDRILFPIGSTEQHGTRGILGTDGLVAEGITRELSRRSGIPCAPTLMFGMAEHHMAFPGTISLKPSTYQAVLSDVLRSFHHHGFRRVMIINGHGGNIAPVECTLSALTNELLDLRVQFWSWFEIPAVAALTEELFGDEEGSHGTPGEVSVTMHLYPEIEFPTYPDSPSLSGSALFYNHRMVREGSPTGLFGGANPNLATAKAGERLLDLSVTELMRSLEDWSL